jgi:CubicO group peptidase (beta-lactamase class C family)
MRDVSPVSLSRTSRLPAVVLAVVATVVSFSPGGRASQQAEFGGIEAIAREELKQRQTPGAAIAVVQDGRVVYAHGFGLANVETGEETRPEMLFRLGSTTKMFTAATVVLLAQQGKLDVKAPIGAHIPGLAPKLAALTAHQLLSHTSGLLDEAPMFGSHDDDALKKEVASWTDARFFAEPGQIYSYSNPGYWLAGLLAERVGGKPFADQVAASVFAPVGMSRSTFRPTIAMTYPLAQGHDLVNGKLQIIRPSANNAASWPAGSIFSNVIDLSRWVTAFLDGGMLEGKHVLPATMFSTLSTANTAIPGSTNKYGYGVQVGEWRGLPMLSHGGSRAGYGSIIRMIPSRRFGVVVLANRSGVEMTRTADAAMEAALKPAPAQTAPARTLKPTTAADRSRFVGVYSQGSRQMTIEAKGDQLFVRQEARETALDSAGDVEFTGGGQRLFFVTDAAGAVTFLHTGGRSWKKIE